MSKRTFSINQLNNRNNIQALNSGSMLTAPNSQTRTRRQVTTQHQNLRSALISYLRNNHPRFSSQEVKNIVKSNTNVHDLVQSLHKIPTRYIEAAKESSAFEWKNLTGHDYRKGAHVKGTHLNRDGSLNNRMLSELIETPIIRNKNLFVFGDKNSEFINAKKTIEKIKFENNTTSQNQTDLIKIKMLVSFEINNKKHLGLNELMFYKNEKQLRSHFSVLVNGSELGAHILTRLDSNGYLDKDFIMEHAPSYTKYIEEKDLPTFNGDYVHSNFFRVGEKEEYKNEFGDKANNFSHMHYTDESYEIAKAIYNLNNIINPNDRKKTKLINSKMNAKNVEFYDNDQSKLADLKKYKTMIPSQQFFNYSLQTLNIDYSNLKSLDKLYDAMNEYRTLGEDNLHLNFDINHFNSFYNIQNQKQQLNSL